MQHFRKCDILKLSQNKSGVPLFGTLCIIVDLDQGIC